ncbi:MAG: ParB N-terminal domain-containing protein [Turicibacter sp.]|nr:ParB N-terminal domain-containing protein [Turicibacter sp.]
MPTTFIKSYPVSRLKSADYNPRRITPERFEDLKHSLSTFGVCKPVIVNQDGTLVAGHQRTKAMTAVGIEETPVFLLDKKISLHDEIRYNLMHNSIETETGICKIKATAKNCVGFMQVEHFEIEVIKKPKASYVKEICQLINKNGDFGSCIIDSDGNILHNSDYAFCVHLLKRALWVYVMPDGLVEEFKRYINYDYGAYYYDEICNKSYVQTHCQMSRDGKSIHSRLYENYVLPNLSPDKTIMDFGAGKMFYIQNLQKKGLKALGYEPYFKHIGKETFDIGAIVGHITALEKQVKRMPGKSGFDAVVLDSVINSVINNEFEDFVLTTCNALLDADGTFYTGTRNLEAIEAQCNLEKKREHRRFIEFFDADNYSITFRKGVVTKQKFHNKASLRTLLEKYFDEVTIGKENGTQLFAVCRQPKKLEEARYRQALETEFNMEYPNGFKHNKHEKLVRAILEMNGFK